MSLRKSRAENVSDAGSRAVETIGELAEQARSLARDVGQVASPALQHSAESLARALERAADSKLAKAGEQQAAEVALVARERLADASEKLAEVIRPKPRNRRHWVRNSAIALAAVGGIAALVQSPLRAKLTERLFGPPPDDEMESITLPGADVSAPPEGSPTQERRTASGEGGNGVPSTTAGAVDTTSQG
jgi:hypothetical protein